MANQLGKIYGTEEDKVNCNFYFKIGACRHGDKCNRIHNRPSISQTLLFKNLYINPPTAIAISEGNKVSDEALREAIAHFENFYEDTFLKLASYGELLELNVCDNLGDHLIGNVYAKFNTEEDAAKAYKGLLGQQYNGKDINVEYSPVTNFKECRCRQYEEGACERGAFCNFLHLKYVSKKFKKSLFEQMYTEHPEYKHKRNRSNSSGNRKYKKHGHHHRRNSSKSSLGSCDSGERRNIIKNWNRRYEKMRENEKKKMAEEEAKKKIKMLEEQLKDNEKKINNDEIFKNILNDDNNNKDLSLTYNNHEFE